MASYLAEVVGFILLLAFTYRYVWPMLKRLMDSQAESIRSSHLLGRSGPRQR